MDYFKANPVDSINTNAFEASCGVGVVITREQIAEKVKEAICGKSKQYTDVNRSVRSLLSRRTS